MNYDDYICSNLEAIPVEGCLLDEAMKQTLAWIERYLNNEVETGLVFSGVSGSGKTHLLRLIIWALNELGEYVDVVDFPALLEEIKFTYEPKATTNEQQILDDIFFHNKFICLDNIGQDCATEWGFKKLDTILSRAYDEKKIVLLTTTLVQEKRVSCTWKKKFTEAISEDTYSRLCEIAEFIETGDFNFGTYRFYRNIEMMAKEAREYYKEHPEEWEEGQRLLREAIEKCNSTKQETNDPTPDC